MIRSSFSRSICAYSPPKHSLLSQNLQPTWFSAFPCFKSLGMISFSLIIHAFHAFRPRFWGFWKILGFFKIVECLLKFWDGFCLNDILTSCIASHMHYNCIFTHLVVFYTCWTFCVLVGLDWAEPMMLFTLQVICSCIFMHMYLTFNIFVYIWTV